VREPEAPEAAFDFSVIRELRRQASVTLERLAEETGVSFSTLNRIESNRNQPSLATLARLAGYFGMSGANLLDLAGARVVDYAEEELATLGQERRRGVTLPDVRVVLGEAIAGQSQTPHNHEGFYQVQWVVRGRMQVRVLGRTIDLAAGQAARFDASYEHAASFVEDTTYLVVLVPKRTR
jgi:transcriptional regulator with XRE-family HTH domain